MKKEKLEKGSILLLVMIWAIMLRESAAMMATLVGLLFSCILLWFREKQLDKKHYQTLLTLALFFFLGTAVLTDAALSSGKFKETIKASEFIYDKFGVFGLILKAIFF